jgi:hypothetical protein
MIRLAGPRCMAMSVVGALFGRWITLDSLSTMAHYRSLSHDALISKLAEKNDGQLTTSIIGGLFLVAAIVIAVDVLTRFFKAVWHRIQPPRAARPSSTPDSAA